MFGVHLLEVVPETLGRRPQDDPVHLDAVRPGVHILAHGGDPARPSVPPGAVAPALAQIEQPSGAVVWVSAIGYRRGCGLPVVVDLDEEARLVERHAGLLEHLDEVHRHHLVADVVEELLDHVSGCRAPAAATHPRLSLEKKAAVLQRE